MLAFLLQGLIDLTYSSIKALIAQHGYLAIFVLMTLESASIPVPSEVVLPAVGYFAAKGQLNVFLGFLAALLAGIVGMGIDYYAAYFFGREVVYKHAHFFHISKERLKHFDSWFAKNGGFAVFVSRMIPVVRGLMSFPAGFAEMPIREFYYYSIPGTVIWDALLIGFGYYGLSSSSFDVLIASIIAFAVVLYLIYRYAIKRMK